MQIKSLGFNLVLYLALIEAIALLTLDYHANPFLIGLIPAFIVLLLYEFLSKYFPVVINESEITDVPIILPAILNGIFILILFGIQSVTPVFGKDAIGTALFGFVSVAAAFLAVLFLYNISPVKIKFRLNKKQVELRKVSYMFVVYAGIFEFFILPTMAVFSAAGINMFVNGLISGLLGGTIAWGVLNLFLMKNPVEVSLKSV